MHQCQYKQKIWQCEILLAHTGSIQALKTVPPSLASSVEPTVSPTLWSTCQVPPHGTGETGWPSTAKWDAAGADALAYSATNNSAASPNIMYNLRIYLSDGF